MLREKQLAFHITTQCTLNCKLCVSMIPEFKIRGKAKHVPFEQVAAEIHAVFSIYDYIEDITLSGGEPLLHPDLVKIIDTCMEYRQKFAHARIFTNGTCLPSDALLCRLKQFSPSLSLVIDDYGTGVSDKTEAIVRLLKDNGLTCRINCYHGSNQHCGGWVDYGSPAIYRGYSETQLNDMYQHCHVAQYRCIGVYNGKMTNCCWGIFGKELGYMPLPENEMQLIDLLDDTISLEEKKQIASDFGKKPLWACQYCNGFDPESSQRYSAGIQILYNDRKSGT